MGAANNALEIAKESIDQRISDKSNQGRRYSVYAAGRSRSAPAGAPPDGSATFWSRCPPQRVLANRSGKKKGRCSVDRIDWKRRRVLHSKHTSR